ncbi:MAG: hypothetical protein P8R54_23795 [Myxococcota bacterium]|nr:hypothetical protein [Myxococcota bacterium]
MPAPRQARSEASVRSPTLAGEHDRALRFDGPCPDNGTVIELQHLAGAVTEGLLDGREDACGKKAP